MNVKPDCAPAQRNCVYYVPCADCRCVYIGQTKRHAPVRLSEHDDAVSKTFNPQKMNSSGYQLAEYAHQLGHKFDWKNATAIKFEPNLQKRLVIESTAIKSNKNPISQANHQLDKIWMPFVRSAADSYFAKVFQISDVISSSVRRTRRAR
jgi:hypothetical protein